MPNRIGSSSQLMDGIHEHAPEKTSVVKVSFNLDSTGKRTAAATAECRTSDITLAEFKTLTGKMDGFNPNARTPQEYLAGTPTFRRTCMPDPPAVTFSPTKRASN
jgi:hypothetical protein